MCVCVRCISLTDINNIKKNSFVGGGGKLGLPGFSFRCYWVFPRKKNKVVSLISSTSKLETSLMKEDWLPRSFTGFLPSFA